MKRLNNRQQRVKTVIKPSEEISDKRKNSEGSNKGKLSPLQRNITNQPPSTSTVSDICRLISLFRTHVAVFSSAALPSFSQILQTNRQTERETERGKQPGQAEPSQATQPTTTQHQTTTKRAAICRPPVAYSVAPTYPSTAPFFGRLHPSSP